MPKKKQADSIEAERRVRAVQEWILQGQATYDIITQLTITYTIGERQAYKYYKRAFERFQESTRVSFEEKKAYHLALRRRLLKNLREQETPTGARAALRIADSMARIDGIAVSTNNNFYKDDDTITTDEDGAAVMRLPDGTEIEL